METKSLPTSARFAALSGVVVARILPIVMNVLPTSAKNTIQLRSVLVVVKPYAMNAKCSTCAVYAKDRFALIVPKNANARNVRCNAVSVVWVQTAHYATSIYVWRVLVIVMNPRWLPAPCAIMSAVVFVRKDVPRKTVRRHYAKTAVKIEQSATLVTDFSVTSALLIARQWGATPRSVILAFRRNLASPMRCAVVVRVYHARTLAVVPLPAVLA
eukprot:CAMPEP_0178610920 /NCGR_PEP_ID=MMETSP0698-20121128/343_1 /TAXON_ID=265572 /ORGANISM="Extubocellulus spinifer, Strain CCMP396" /LENGTH=213 /DNA_ID=CAMNT_0020249531 /DNA_START=1174 /DNA_END=1815 /DNA_ORIENTATION=-